MALFGGLQKLLGGGPDLRNIAMQAAIPEQRSTPTLGMNLPPDGGFQVNGAPVNPDPEQLMKMARPAPSQNKGGNRLRRFAQRFRTEIMPGLQAAGAIAQGDFNTAAQIQALAMRQASERQQSDLAAEQFERMTAQVANLPGMTAREFLSYLNNPEQWASHMADALATQHAAANVGQTETRVFGNPAQGGSMYQPPRLIENGVDQIRHDPMTGENSIAYSGMTEGEQYARSLRHQPGSPAWNQSVQDAELGGNGPTAYGYDSQLEQLRQGNRMQLRGSPTYAQSNPSPRRSGGRGSSGEPVQVRTVQEANSLPPGTLYRTPDGRTRRR